MCLLNVHGTEPHIFIAFMMRREFNAEQQVYTFTFYYRQSRNLISKLFLCLLNNDLPFSVIKEKFCGIKTANMRKFLPKRLYTASVI